MRAIILILCLTPVPAYAHLGHLADVAGHGHWIGLAAGAAAAAAAAWGLRGRKDEEDDVEEEISDAPEEELQEA
jgi:hypothetical protein